MSAGGEGGRDESRKKFRAIEGGAAKKDEMEHKDAQSDKTRDLIGQNLRKVYDDIAAEPLPDRFVELLDKLKKGEG